MSDRVTEEIIDLIEALQRDRVAIENALAEIADRNRNLQSAYQEEIAKASSTITDSVAKLVDEITASKKSAESNKLRGDEILQALQQFSEEAERHSTSISKLMQESETFIGEQVKEMVNPIGVLVEKVREQVLEIETSQSSTNNQVELLAAEVAKIKTHLSGGLLGGLFKMK